MLQQAKDLISFRAFNPSFKDVKVFLKERLMGDSVMGLMFSQGCITCSEIKIVPDQITIENQKTFILSGEDEQLKTITSFAKKHGLSKAIVLASPGFEAVRIDKSFPYKGVERLYVLKHNINAILDGSEEEGRAHIFVNNPFKNESLIFSYNEEKVDGLSRLISDSCIDVLRFTCGIYAPVEYLIEETDFLEKDHIFIQYTGNAVFVIAIRDKQFRHIGFRAKVDLKDLEQIIPRIIERFNDDYKEFTYVNCSDWDILAFFKEVYPDMKLTPAFEDSRKGVFQSACYG